MNLQTDRQTDRQSARQTERLFGNWSDAETILQNEQQDRQGGIRQTKIDTEYGERLSNTNNDSQKHIRDIQARQSFGFKSLTVS